MKTEHITFDVIQAKDIEPFTVNGKRYLNYHYFLKNDDGWMFMWVDNDLDINWLKQKISEGKIYVFQD